MWRIDAHSLPLSAPLGKEGVERLDDEPVVLELGEARDRDGAHTSGAPDKDREGAAVRGVDRGVQPRVRVEGPTVDPELLADAEGGSAVPIDNSRLALEPAIVVGAGARKR